MKAAVHGEAVRTARDSIAAEAEAFAFYERTKAAMAADPQDPAVQSMFKRAQRVLQRILEREEIEFPSPPTQPSSTDRDTVSSSADRDRDLDTPSSSGYISSQFTTSPASSTGGLSVQFLNVSVLDETDSDSFGKGRK
eukprot:1177335-Rhodomonas_salina.1